MNTRIRLPDDLATRLVRRAARRAPAALADRLEEEWLAELAVRSGATSRLRLALGCTWAQQALARDPLWATAPATLAPAEGGHWMVHAPSRPARRVAVIAVIAGLHAAAILSFLYGVAPHPPAHKATESTGVFINEPQPPAPLPHPLRPAVGGTATVAPLGPVSIGPITIEDPGIVPTGAGVPGVAVAPAHEARLTRGGPGASFPATRDYYPAAAIRFEEQGLATIGVCVDAHGRLSAEPVVQRSSGYPRLDAGALALARAGSGHYRANSEDDRAVPGCFSFGVRFALER